jgi:SWI/SNF-related matrix-associated actin-dependent regulator of chromatin subfamily A3
MNCPDRTKPQMGLGKTITCLALISATMDAAASFANTPLELPPPPSPRAGSEPPLSADHFLGSVWGMPGASESGNSAKAKAKAAKLQDKLEAEHVRACRIKAKSRATLVVCPLSTVANWEDQFREHWRGKVSVFGGSGSCISTSTTPTSQRSSPSPQYASCASTQQDAKTDSKSKRKYEGKPLRVYVYHGNARRPDPAFLADFDVVVTTYATLATEFSKQSRSLLSAEDEDEEVSDETGVIIDVDERGNEVIRLPQPKKNPLKRKKPSLATLSTESSSALQSVHWFRIVLDEAQ